MKYVKMLGLLALAASAMMAFAASASATTLTNNGTPLGVGTVISAAKESNHITLTGPLGTAAECQESSVSGSITNAGSVGTTPKANITTLSLNKCTNGYVIHVIANGSLEFHAVSPTGNATITSSGTTVTVTNVPFVGTCGYLTNNTDIGILTGSLSIKGTATIHLKASIPFHSGSALCGSVGVFLGSYRVTSPDKLDYH